MAFAGQGFLQLLRDTGFQTFDGIIDESYDNIDTDIDRYVAAMDQVKLICNQPSENILKQIEDIVEHNYHLMINTNWHTALINDTKISPTSFT